MSGRWNDWRERNCSGKVELPLANVNINKVKRLNRWLSFPWPILRTFYEKQKDHELTL